MYLIVGLGNPGAQYRQTRHNIGFIFLEYLADKHGLSFADSRWKAKVCKAVLWGRQVVLAKPETYMNLSGIAVSQIAAYYKISPEDILVIHDDLDLPPGRIKMTSNRGAGGHNGITSIISHLGSKAFVRIRIGVGRPAMPAMAVTDFVLGRLSGSDLDAIEQHYQDLEKGVSLYLEGGHATAMNFLNTLKPQP